MIYDYIIFHIIPNQKIREKKYYKFQCIPYWLRSIKNLRMRFGVWASLERRVDEIKNSESKIIF